MGKRQDKHEKGTFYSWEILNDIAAVKTCDKSFFEHQGSAIPQEICWFFDAKNLDYGESKSVILRYNGADYTASVTNSASGQNQVQIRWKSDLAKQLKKFSEKEKPKATFKKISEDVFELLLNCEQEVTHKTWLLSWNPNKWNWEDYDSAITLTKAGNAYKCDWTCSNTHVSVGDRVFLILLGTGKTNGIFASGKATSVNFESEHWDLQKREQGIKAKKITVEFDKVIDYRKDSVLSQNELNEAFPKQQWSPQNSGIEIKEEYVEELESLWQKVSESADELCGEEPVQLTPKESIEQICSYIASKGFTYSNALISNFYLSLKAKPFVILAGTSGTGKTRLVRLFAEAIGAEYKLVSVRPDWSDGSDLFGHTDLNGNFIEGPVCESFRLAYDNPNKPVFLCLDEMNLARVEYYLSDFLSVIESREKSADGKITTTSIAQYPEGIPENLYFIGTVNMDETTFPFSKKVLDRANTIEFSEVDLMPEFDDAENNPEPLQLPNSFLHTEYLVLTRDCAEEKEYVKKICTKLQAMNDILKKANAHIGYRVRDEIVFYMLNNKKAEELVPENQAFDNEIMQKILPRIQGSSAEIKNLLIDLFKFCMGNSAGIDEYTGSVGELMRSVSKDAIYRNSASKIGYMMSRYEDDGFTSYWL